MAGLLDTARPLDRFRTLLAPDPGWQYGSFAPMKSRTPLDPIYGAPQVMDTQFSLAIPDVAREMVGSLLTTLEAPYTGVMPSPADLLNITPMTSAPGLLVRVPAGALASGLTRRGVGDNQGPPLGPDPAEVSPLGFYSPTEQAVLNLKQATLTPDQARASLANLGAKKEEMQWMGMDDFLANRTSVTQDELLDFVRQNRVNVEQVNYGGADPEALVRQANELMAQGQRVQASGDLDGARVLFDRHDDLMRQAEGLEASPQGLLAPKFSDPNLQLPGGENYREVVLTMPQRTPPSEFGDYLKRMEAKYGSDYPASMTIDESMRLNKLADAHKAVRELQPNIDFRGGHFPDENALAHVRLTDRIDADGKKVLFIEEIQSDWHQKGRLHGYKGFSDNKEDMALLEKHGISFERNPEEPDISAFKDMESGDLLGLDELRFLPWLKLPDDVFQAAVRLDAGGGVPDAPFKQSWSDLSMMRIMKMAADEGYDRVAWTTGRMQADRYDLSKQVDQIDVINHVDGGRFVDVRKDGNLILDMQYDEAGKITGGRPEFIGKDLSDVLGKEMAEKVLAVPPRASPLGQTNLAKSFKGIDLQVGGEGMIKFYDQMLPKKAQKIARRLDKDATVGTREISTGDEVYSIWNTISGHSVGGGYSRARAQQIIDADDHHRMVLESGGTNKVWSVDITPAMRKTIGRQPLFAANPGAVAAPGLLSTQQPAPPPSLIMDSRERVPRGLLDAAA